MRYALNNCHVLTRTGPDNSLEYVFTGPCVVTGKPYTVVIDSDSFDRYAQGALIQDAMPTVPREDREFLISGTSPEGWELTFSDEDIFDAKHAE